VLTFQQEMFEDTRNRKIQWINGKGKTLNDLQNTI